MMRKLGTALLAGGVVALATYGALYALGLPPHPATGLVAGLFGGVLGGVGIADSWPRA